MLTQERLKELLSYDKETGLFTWLVDRGNRKKGATAGCVLEGYVRMSVDGVKCLAHRLAFLYVDGKLPENEVDHINGKRDDNRFINIRLATGTENQKNRGISKNNKSGVTGVSWIASNGKWKADIKLNGKTMHLGCFNELADASMARVEAEKKYGFHNNHGKRKATYNDRS